MLPSVMEKPMAISLPAERVRKLMTAISLCFFHPNKKDHFPNRLRCPGCTRVLLVSYSWEKAQHDCTASPVQSNHEKHCPSGNSYFIEECPKI